MYDVHHQCRLQYGPGAQYCHGIDVSVYFGQGTSFLFPETFYAHKWASLEKNVQRLTMDVTMSEELLANSVLFDTQCAGAIK